MKFHNEYRSGTIPSINFNFLSRENKRYPKDTVNTMCSRINKGNDDDEIPSYPSKLDRSVVTIRYLHGHIRYRTSVF